MAKRRRLARNSAHHLTEDALLLLIDGVLSKREEEQAARHLRDCWRCRGLRDRLESAIGAFMAERLDDLSALDADFEDKDYFAARLARHACAPDLPSPRFHLFRLARRAIWPLAAAAAALAATGAWTPLPEYIVRLAIREEVPAILPPPPPKAPILRVIPPVVAPPAPALKPPSPELKIPPLLAGPTSAGLDAAESAAYLALHDLGLCRGNAIKVLRVPGESIRIVGVAERQQQAQNLKAALAGFELIDVRVETPGHDLPPASAYVASGLPLKPQPPLLAARLKEHFRRHSPPERAGREMADYSSRTVRLAATASSEAQALRTLAGVFTARRIRTMDRKDRARLAHAVDEHLREFQHSMAQLGQNLDQLGYALPSPAAEPPPDARSWEELAVLLEQHGVRIDYLASGLFAGLDLPGLDAGSAWSELCKIHHQSQSLLRTAGDLILAAWRQNETQAFRTTRQGKE